MKRRFLLVALLLLFFLAVATVRAQDDEGGDLDPNSLPDPDALSDPTTDSVGEGQEGGQEASEEGSMDTASEGQDGGQEGGQEGSQEAGQAGTTSSSSSSGKPKNLNDAIQSVLDNSKIVRDELRETRKRLIDLFRYPEQMSLMQSQLHDQILNLMRELTKAQTDIIVLRGELALSKDKLRVCENSNGKEQINAQASAQLSQAQRDALVTSCNAQLKARNEELARVSKEKSTLEQRITAAEERADKCNVELQSAKTACASAATTETECQAKIKATMDELSNTNKLLVEERSKFNAKEGEVASLKAQVQAASGNQGTTAASMQKLTKEVQECNAKLGQSAQCNEQLKQTKHEVDKLQKIPKVKWIHVLYRGPGEKDRSWAVRIYNAMIGKEHHNGVNPNEGGVNHIMQGLVGKHQFDLNTASWMCHNPCYWYYSKGSAESKASIDNVQLCDCKANKAIHF